MSPEQRLADDRALRDAARAVFLDDIRLLRANLGTRGVGERIAGRFGDGAQDLLDDAVDFAETNKGHIAAVAAAIVLWFSRGPILRAMASLIGIEGDEPEQKDDDVSSASD